MARPSIPKRARSMVASSSKLGRNRRAPKQIKDVAKAITEAADGGTVTDRAYQQIEELIVTLELPPGSVLSEQMMSQRFDISRTPIREALKRLEQEGLVTVLPRRGVLVSEINLRKQLQLLEVRREIERLLARLAAKNAKEEERQEFLEIGKKTLRSAEEVNEIEFGRLDQRLNELEWKAARNEYATKMISLVNGLSRRFWFQHFKETGDLPLAAKVHADLAFAIAEADTKAAEDASDRLIDYIENFARKTLEG